MNCNPISDVSVPFGVVAFIDSEREAECVNRPISLRRQLQQLMLHLLLEPTLRLSDDIVQSTIGVPNAVRPQNVFIQIRPSAKPLRPIVP